MTTDRAVALAQQDDYRKVREFYASKRPITSFFGSLGGQAIDPLNYIPVFGEAVTATNALRPCRGKGSHEFSRCRGECSHCRADHDSSS